TKILSRIVPPPPGIATLSLHDALPIYQGAFRGCAPLPRRARRGPDRPCRPSGSRRHDGPVAARSRGRAHLPGGGPGGRGLARTRDRKSTRLNSSHVKISSAVFCLKKKIKQDYLRHIGPPYSQLLGSMLGNK